MADVARRFAIRHDSILPDKSEERRRPGRHQEQFEADFVARSRAITLTTVTGELRSRQTAIDERHAVYRQIRFLATHRSVTLGREWRLRRKMS